MVLVFVFLLALVGFLAKRWTTRLLWLGLVVLVCLGVKWGWEKGFGGEVVDKVGSHPSFVFFFSFFLFLLFFFSFFFFLFSFFLFSFFFFLFSFFFFLFSFCRKERCRGSVYSRELC